MPSSGKISGSLLKLKIGATNITHQMSAGWKHSTATRDVTTKDSGKNSEFLSTLHNWTMDTEFIFAPDAAYGADEVLAAKITGDAVAATITSGVTGDTEWTGSVIITEADLKSGVEDNVMVSVSLQGTGAFTAQVIT